MVGFLGIFVPFQYGLNDERRFTPHALRYAGPVGSEHWKRSVTADIGLLFPLVDDRRDACSGCAPFIL